MRGIDHPEVADLAAVSAAVARLRDSKGSAGPHLRCVEAAAKYLGNALQNPTLGKVKAGSSRSIYVVHMCGQEGHKLVVPAFAIQRLHVRVRKPVSLDRISSSYRFDRFLPRSCTEYLETYAVHH